MDLSKKHIERFWSKVVKDGDCLLWDAYCNEKGYGYFYDGSKMRRVHRISYELNVGEIPDSTEIDHLCSVRKCVNPAHLEAVTHKTNCYRGIGSKKHCKRGHEFTEQNTFNYAQRVCVTCSREAKKRYRLKLGEKSWV